MLRHSLVGVLFLMTTCQAFAEPLSLSIGARKAIDLKENRTTGYVWRIDERTSRNPGVLRIEDKGYSPPGGSLPGAAGTHTWVFEGLAKGSARIEFVYQRPWETTPIKRDARTVDVR